MWGLTRWHTGASSAKVRMSSKAWWRATLPSPSASDTKGAKGAVHARSSSRRTMVSSCSCDFTHTRVNRPPRSWNALAKRDRRSRSRMKTRSAKSVPASTAPMLESTKHGHNGSYLAMVEVLASIDSFSICGGNMRCLEMGPTFLGSDGYAVKLHSLQTALSEVWKHSTCGNKTCMTRNNHTVSVKRNVVSVFKTS